MGGKPMFLRNYWYVAAYDHEIGRNPLGRIILGEPIVFYRLSALPPPPLPPHSSPHRPPAALHGDVGRRYFAVPLPRTSLRQDRHLRAGAGPGHDSTLGAGQELSRGRALPLAVDLDGRSRAGRSRQDHRFPLVRRPEL